MTDAKEEGLWDYLEIYCATTKTDNLGITALSISYYEEMFRNPSEFDISLKKKRAGTFLAAARRSAEVSVQSGSESAHANWCEGNLMHLGNE